MIGTFLYVKSLEKNIISNIGKSYDFENVLRINV